MSLLRYIMAGLLCAAIGGQFERAQAQQGIEITIIVFEDGSAEINCPTSACQAICRDVEGQSLLVQGQYYRIGSNCAIELSDGSATQAALEQLAALLGLPTTAIRVTGDTGGIDPDVFNSGEADESKTTEQTTDESPATLQ